jgi:hypothetical protein
MYEYRHKIENSDNDNNSRRFKKDPNNDIENNNDDDDDLKDNDNNHGNAQQPLSITAATILAYYTYFLNLTNNGIVFYVDLSSDPEAKKGELTKQEKDERLAYYRTIHKLHEHYMAQQQHLVCISKEEVLQQRIVAPRLKAEGKVSWRSSQSESRANRFYPPNINVWEGFQSEVAMYNLNDDKTELFIESVFFKSLSRARQPAVTDEYTEQKSLLKNLDVLRVAGIVQQVLVGKDIRHVEAAERFRHVDFCVKKDDVVTIVCECKPNHNL